MPRYTFRCALCNVQTEEQRSFAHCTDPAACPHCQQPMPRVFTADFFMTTEREADKPENKYALGFDETTRRETMKADDKQYDKNWEGQSFAPIAPKESLTDVFHRTPYAAT